MENGFASLLSPDLLQQQNKRRLYKADGYLVRRHNGASPQVPRVSLPVSVPQTLNNMPEREYST